MSDKKPTLEEALLARGFDPNSFLKNDDAVFDRGMLEQVASIWKDRKEAIMAVLQARLDTLSRYMVYKAEPVEIPELRRAHMEIAELVNDFNTYTTEYEKRSKGKNNENNENKEEKDETPPSDEEKSSV